MKRKFNLFLSTFLCSVGLQNSAFAQERHTKMQTSMKVTYEIYSGRNSPYFELNSPDELLEIHKSLATVSTTNIQIGKKNSNVFFDDSKSLRAYLDKLRLKHGVVSPR